ncbi:MAG: hypothetical protein ABI614_19770 [Planctomycetota bacterium]
MPQLTRQLAQRSVLVIRVVVIMEFRSSRHTNGSNRFDILDHAGVAIRPLNGH